ncbi:MAG: four helix bundle protein [Bacteroidales bacterium]
MDYKDLNTWQISIQIVKEIYNLTGRYPKNELFALTDQMRRAAISISSNIAEGSARNSDKEMLHFLYIALGSRAELETQLIISQHLDYVKESQFSEIDNQLVILRRSILGLIKYLKRKQITNNS